MFPAAGGECGPRAFWGRFTRKAFGLPTFGVTQPGHAAMTTWSPTGWVVLLGATWKYGWWGPRGGPDFYLETQCRELRSEYQQVLRGMWAADALGEEPVNQGWTPMKPTTYGQGGVWNALMLYAKKIATNSTVPPPRTIGPAVVPSKVGALVDKWSNPLPPQKITTDAQGNIHIPATAYFWKNASTNIVPMWSYDQGEQLQVNDGDYVDPTSTSFSYAIDVEEDRTMYLTATHATYHMNTDLLVQSNTSSALTRINVFYTVGYLKESQPVEIQLLKGTNVLTFSRSTYFAIVIKNFTLYVNKPNIPPPPKNHSSNPIPPSSSFIQVPDSTTCIKQGIQDVPEKACEAACQAVGANYTGAHPVTNTTYCYTNVDGPAKGSCFFNTNTTASNCETPPCLVDGSTVAQICIRR